MIVPERFVDFSALLTRDVTATFSAEVDVDSGTATFNVRLGGTSNAADGAILATMTTSSPTFEAKIVAGATQPGASQPPWSRSHHGDQTQPQHLLPHQEQASRPGGLTLPSPPGREWVGGWVAPREEPEKSSMNEQNKVAGPLPDLKPLSDRADSLIAIGDGLKTAMIWLAVAIGVHTVVTIVMRPKRRRT